MAGAGAGHAARRAPCAPPARAPAIGGVSIAARRWRSKLLIGLAV
jgi:hypothetical protein